jgi:hypothetical protein
MVPLQANAPVHNVAYRRLLLVYRTEQHLLRSDVLVVCSSHQQ